MSIVVDPADLERALEDFDYAYLLTTAAGAGVKVVTVEPRVVADGLRISEPGRGSLQNVALNRVVTLTFPPRRFRGYTLIVDGTATADAAGLLVVADRAVLHRPAAHADGPPADSADGCGQDCAPIG